MKDNSADIFAVSIVMAFILIYYIRRSRRKRKNIYGFEIENWSILKDDSVLYEIETQFKQGIIAQALKQSGYSIEDWHSNLIHRNLIFITGYIELSLYKVGIGFDALIGKSNGLTNLTLVPISFKANRYFIGKVQHLQNHLVNMSSENLVQISQLKMESISEELNRLENKFGINKWKFIYYQNYIVLLVPEIWDQSGLIDFIGIGESICGKFSQSLNNS